MGLCWKGLGNEPLLLFRDPTFARRIAGQLTLIHPYHRARCALTVFSPST
jgi:hypothetical protein